MPAPVPPDTRYFNPRSPRGGATSYSSFAPSMRYISIHAPHEGERPDLKHHRLRDIVFQSTLPTRGSDMKRGGLHLRHMHFNPRSPRGGATEGYGVYCVSDEHFNPRSPRGGATGWAAVSIAAH